MPDYLDPMDTDGVRPSLENIIIKRHVFTCSCCGEETVLFETKEASVDWDEWTKKVSTFGKWQEIRKQNPLRRYIHDCEDCVFLGQYKDADLYVCINNEDGNTIDTVIARFSSDAPDYISGLTFAYAYGEDLSFGEDSQMRYTFEAFKRAISRGCRP